MQRFTQANLKQLNTLDLYKHAHALSSSIAFLSDEAKQRALDELKECTGLRSAKVDGLHYAITKHESLIEVGKAELDSLKAAIKRHELEVKTIKSYLKELARQGYADKDNKINGERYQFTISPIKSEVEISGEVEDWEHTEQQKCAIVKKVVTTTILESVDGQHLETTERITQSLVPNLDVIRDLHVKGQKLPDGVQVKKNYAIRTKRVIKAMD